MSPNLHETTRDQIEQQLALVSSLRPGSEQHRIATTILLLLQDSLHLQQQIDELKAEAGRRVGGATE